MSWRRVLIALGVAIPTIALLAFGMTVDPKELPSVLPGKEAPSFTLDVLQYSEAPPSPEVVSLADHRGEVVVLNFWASWCVACRGEHAPLSAVARRYQGKGVQFYGVLYNDRPENGVMWIRQMGGQAYPAVLDPNKRTAIDYGLYGVPETFFIGRDGRVAHKHVGPVTDALLTEWIEKLRNEPMEATG